MGRKNPIVHVEWHSNDSARLRKFYESVFNWKWSDPMPGYALIDTGSKEGAAGLAQIVPERPMPAGIVSYIDVDDLGAAEERIAASGGSVFVSKMEVPGMGHFSLFKDVDGNSVGIWQSAAPPKKAAKRAAKAAKKAAKKATKAAKKSKGKK
jgi:predicted enzyme related to lactoylglutathione lyase